MLTSAIVVVGSLNADFVARVARFPAPGETVTGQAFAVFPGGKGANQAAAAARLGGRVAMVGQVGADVQGPWLARALAETGVDVSSVLTDPDAPSGVALITIDGSGANTIVVVPGANGTLGPAWLDGATDALRTAGVLLLQLEIPLDTVVRAAEITHGAGGLVVLDPAPARPLPDRLLALCSYVTPNEAELAVLTGGAPSAGDLSTDEVRARAAALRAHGASRVLVTLGARGARLFDETGETSWPAPPVVAVDTTAAGDAFNGAFAVALAEHQTLDRAGRFATAAAALSVTRHGAQPSLPARDEVEELLRGIV